MKKEKTKSWSNVPFLTWEYEPQTEMKHKVLRYYLPMWAKILGKHNTELNYIDGFGGIGAYHHPENTGMEYSMHHFGSPIFSLQTISRLQQKGEIDNANIIIIDENSDNIQNLKQIVEYIGNDNPNIHYINGDFDSEINQILENDCRIGMYPSFFLIDPFGFSIKFNTIKKIMEKDKTEVLINFMYNAISRYVHHPSEKITKLYDELFGTPQWRNHADKSGEEKELSLVKLFREQCKEIASFVYPYKLNFPEKNRPYYYLFHLSNHYLACKLMKEAFAANNNNEFEYTGEQVRQPNLFDIYNEKHELAVLTNLCSKCFVEKKANICMKCMQELLDVNSLTYRKFLGKIVDCLPFTEKEIKRMLNDFEKKGYLRVNSLRKRRQGFQPDDVLVFSFEGE